MRESLFEKLKNRELSYVRELKKINVLLRESFNTHYYYSQAFKKSPFKVFHASFDESLFEIFANNEDRYPIDYDLSDLIDYTIQIEDDLTLDCFLDYLELFKSIYGWGEDRHCDSNVEQIVSIVDNDCERLGYTFISEDNGSTYKVMLRNPEAEAVATQVKETVRDKIYKYLTIRGGRIDDKRACIKSLADDVEIICKKYSNIPEYNKLKQFIQCTRHTKDDPNKEFPFYYDDEEKWLDKTFDMIIGILSFTNAKKIVSEIKGLEKSDLR